MKHLQKSRLFLFLFLLIIGLLAGCGSSERVSSTEKPAATSTETNTQQEGNSTQASSETEKKVFTIGITQIVEHPALDAAKEGFIKALADNGYVDGEKVKFDQQNAQGSRDTATSIAQKFVADKVDMIFAIATPTAQAAAQATADIPILITAVTDPVAAGLVKSNERPETNVTGTTDMNPVKEQLSLVTKVKPDAKKVGILYNSGETNSEVQIKLAESVAPELGLELVLKGITNSSEVQQAAQSLVGKVDAIYVPTDNTVVSALESVLGVAEQAKIPVVAGEGDSVRRGAVITYGLDYYKLGYQTGEMAIKVLNGTDPSTMPIETQKDMQLIVNKKAAANMGVELSEELLKEADEVIE
ncbi:ABC transporter substrate-binding protein [Microaerobacter geothermalis]|nr:ABC transporter substrate-binding protein [Microaerobacter geothermalis]MCF6093659.1 ABC transporter substrate-binding protein [Microaerobacter geothermalis]